MEQQSIRLYTRTNFPTLGPAGPIGISISSTDLETGVKVRWTEEIGTDSSGAAEILFHGAFKASYGHRYRVEVTRERDVNTSAIDLYVPLKVETSVGPLAEKLPIGVSGDAFILLKPTVEYEMRLAGFGDSPVISYFRDYRNHTNRVEKAWRFEVDIRVDRQWAQSRYNQQAPALTGIECHAMELIAMRLHAIVGDTTWNPPLGVFDPNILSHPGTMSNVENGLGFIGGGYRISADIYPGHEEAEEACFAQSTERN